MLGADLGDRLAAVASDGSPLGTASVERVASRDALMLAEAQARALATLLPAVSRQELWIAMAPPADPALPGELLRVLRAAGVAVQGFADRSALLAGWLPDCPAVVVADLSRQQFALGQAECDGEAALRRHVALAGGEQSLHDAWVQLAAATLVQQTRFDPLHDLRHEQTLREQIPALAAAAQRDGQAQCQIDTGSATLTLALTRDQFATAARPVLAPLAAALQALAAAHGEAALLVPESMLALPGIDEVLAGAHFARTLGFADGLAASAASHLVASGTAGDGGVPYRTRLPALTTLAPEGVLRALHLDAHDARIMATHVVWRGKVLPIPATGLVIGRDPNAESALRLPEGLAGLSRRHCTLRRDGARAQVIDHSSHGTYLDGTRVRGRALLPAGSTLKLGDPGIELPLVAIETG